MAIPKTQHLRFLVAVVECGGVIKAAEYLHLSQPSISAGLKALEEQLGGAIFERQGPSNRPLRLTPAGQRLYQRAADIINQCEAAITEFSSQPHQYATRVRLGVLDTLPQNLISNAIHHLKAIEPELRLDIWEGSTSRLTGWFIQDRVDLIWSNVGDLTPHSRVLWREPLVAVASPNHDLAKAQSTIPLRALAKTPFIHRSNCELDSLGRARLKGANVKLDVRIRAEREELAFQFVRNGMGITLAPRSLAPSDLTIVEVAGLDIERTIGLQWHENTPTQIPLALSSAIKKGYQ